MNKHIWTVFLFPIIFLQTTFVYASNIDRLRTEIIELIKDKHATVGVAVIFNGDNILTINNDARYPLLSVFKFHQAIALANYLAKENIPLSSTIHIKKSDLQPNTYSPLREKYPAGNIDITISDLLKYTLQLSDNNACDILFNTFINPIKTDKYIRSLGINDFSISQTEKDMHDNLDSCYENWTSPVAAAKLLDIFLTAKMMPPCYFDFIRNVMIECKTGNDRLKRYLPSDKAIVGHKTGTGDKNRRNEIIGLNDIGFVLLPDGQRYTIAVLIKNSSESFQNTAQIIADISWKVFNYLAGDIFVPAQKPRSICAP